MKYDGYQAGIDKLIPTSSGNLYMGFMGGYTHAKPDYKQGSGTVKDYSAGVYATYVDNNALHVDSYLKYMHMQNEFNITDTAGSKVKGKTKANGYSVSVEAGKPFAIKESPFYVEPQVQLAYTHMGSNDTHATNGLKVKLNSYDSVLGRTSLVAGYRVDNSKNPTDVYVKTGYVRELAGKTSYKLNQRKEKYSFKGGWFDNSIGVSTTLNKKHNVYGEVGFSKGSRFDKQQLNLGYRYQF